MLETIKKCFWGTDSETDFTKIKNKSSSIEERRKTGRAKAFEEFNKIVTEKTKELEEYYLSKQVNTTLEQFKKKIGILSESDKVPNYKFTAMETFITLKNKYKDHIFLTKLMLDKFKDYMEHTYSLYFSNEHYTSYKYNNSTIIKLKNFLDNFKDKELCSICAYSNGATFWAPYKSLPQETQSILDTLQFGAKVTTETIKELYPVLEELETIRAIFFGQLVVFSEYAASFILLRLTEEIYVLIDHVDKLKGYENFELI